MSQPDNKALAYQVYDAINQRDIAALEALFDPQVIRHAAGEIGFEPAKKAVENTFTLMPDKHFVVEDLFGEGDRVALRVAIVGGELEPGQRQPIIMEVFRFENGRVAEIWGAGGVRLP
jgi:predicted ester cyclase